MSLQAKIEEIYLICSSTMREHFWRFMKFCSHIEQLQMQELVWAHRWLRTAATEFTVLKLFDLLNQEEVSFTTIEAELDKSLKPTIKSLNSYHHTEVNLIQTIPMCNMLYQASWASTNRWTVLPKTASPNKKWSASLNHRKWEEVKISLTKDLFKEW